MINVIDLKFQLKQEASKRVHCLDDAEKFKNMAETEQKNKDAYKKGIEKLKNKDGKYIDPYTKDDITDKVNKRLKTFDANIDKCQKLQAQMEQQAKHHLDNIIALSREINNGKELNQAARDQAYNNAQSFINTSARKFRDKLGNIPEHVADMVKNTIAKWEIKRLIRKEIEHGIH